MGESYLSQLVMVDQNLAKGKRVKILAHGCGGGDANRVEDVGDSAGQSFLFCLTCETHSVESDYREKHMPRGRAPGFSGVQHAIDDP